MFLSIVIYVIGSYHYRGEVVHVTYGTDQPVTLNIEMSHL